MSEIAAADAKKLLGDSVEESRAKRLEKQKSRFRDRGGIFVPSESNPLLDKLLARGINGESPLKGRRKSRARSHSKSPSKRKGKERAVDIAHDELGDTGVKHTGRDKRKSDANVRDAATKKKKAPVRKKKKDVVTVPDVAEGQPVAGPSRTAKLDKSRPRVRKVKAKPPITELSGDEEDAPLQEEAEATRARRTKNNAKVLLAAPSPTKSKPIGGTKQKQTRSAKITEVDPNNRIMGNKTTAQARIDTAATDQADTIQRKKDRQIISKPVRIRKPPDKTGDTSQTYDGKLTSEPDRQGTNTVPSRSKKRSLPIVESGDELMSDHAFGAKPVVVRKKPRLPTPSDSEDDDVSLIALARKRLQARRLEAITQEGAAPKRPEAATKAAPNEIDGGNSLQSRISPEADPGTDTRITASQGAKHHRSMGEQADGHTHTMRKASGETAIKGNPQFESAGDKDNAVIEQHGSDAEQSNTTGRKGRTSRKRQADEPNNVPLNDVGRKKARPRGTVKKRAAKEDDGQEESRDDGVSPLTERPLEVIADKPLNAKRPQKENRGPTKRKAAPRRLAPRVSGLAPLLAGESDDELDLLR